VLRFNQYLDAVVAGTFLILVSIVFLLSVREWLLLIARKRLADLRETPPTWLPDYAIAEGKPMHALSYFALFIGLAKELSVEAEIERARVPECACAEHQVQKTDAEIYVSATEARYKSIRRCC
jgi:hypothetical protein